MLGLEGHHTRADAVLPVLCFFLQKSRTLHSSGLGAYLRGRCRCSYHIRLRSNFGLGPPLLLWYMGFARDSEREKKGCRVLIEETAS